jgi:hypothetical protein
MLTCSLSLCSCDSPFTTDIYIKRDKDRAAAAKKTASTPAKGKKQTKKDM